MRALTRCVRNFLKNEDGPTAVEYAVMLALVFLARGIAGSCYFGSNSYRDFDYHNNMRDEADIRHAEMARTDLLWMAAQAIATVQL